MNNNKIMVLDIWQRGVLFFQGGWVFAFLASLEQKRNTFFSKIEMLNITKLSIIYCKLKFIILWYALIKFEIIDINIDDLSTPLQCTQRPSVHNAQMYTTPQCTQSPSVHIPPVYTEPQCTKCPSVHKAPVYTKTQCIQSPSVHIAQVYTEPQCTQSPSVHKAPVYTEPQCTHSPSVHRAPVYT